MKDPAFLFYSKDFYEGTRMMLPEERACYMDLLVYQHQNGIIPNDIKRVLMYCNGIDETTLIATLEAKFEKSEKGWENKRLAEEISARENYKSGQSESGKIGQFWKKAKKFLAKKDYDELRKELTDRDFIIEFTEKNEININTLKGLLEGSLKHIANANEDVNTDNQVLEFFNNTCEKLPKVKILTDVRKTKLRNRIKEFGEDQVKAIFEEVSRSNFLNGENNNNWTATFDWILEPKNFTKILEGNYKNKENGTHNNTKQSTYNGSGNFSGTAESYQGGKTSFNQILARKLEASRNSEGGDITIDAEVVE